MDSVMNKIQYRVWERLENDLGKIGFKMDFSQGNYLVVLRRKDYSRFIQKDYMGIKLLKTFILYGLQW